MKKIVYLAVGFSFFLAIAYTFQSCNNNDVAGDDNTCVTNDSFIQNKLLELGKAVRYYAKSLHGAITRLHEGEFTPIEEIKISSIADSVFAQTVDSLFFDVDLTIDLTNEQIALLSLDEDSIELNSIDPYAFYNYALRCKTPAFCSFYRSVMRGDQPHMSIDDIISNTQLSINEQVTLVIVEALIDQLETEFPLQLANPIQYVEDCMRAFTYSNGACQATLIASVGVAVGMAASSGGFLTLASALRCGSALFAYYKCLRLAKSEYENCLYRNGLM